MKKQKEKGFSLIELLATIVILSFILGITGYFVINAIKSSKEESQELAINNIKRIANIYIEEYPDDIIWESERNNSSNSYSCIPIQVLVNKGYLKEGDLKKETLKSLGEYILIIKDANGVILKEEISTNSSCTSNIKKVNIPTSKKYCKDITYHPQNNNQILTKNLKTEDIGKFSFSNNTGGDAGSYQIVAQLSENYVWSDNTTEDKIITCNIKKKIPYLTLNPSGDQDTTIGITKTQLTTDTPGIIQIKSSNKDQAIATIDNKNIDKTATIEIQKLATRNTTTSITITLTPSDTKNYYSSSTTYIIGKVDKSEVPIPTAEQYCESRTYNGTSQLLTKFPAVGVTFFNNYGTEIKSDYLITAKLKYGYIWADHTTEDKTFYCSIKVLTPTVTYDSNGGNACNPTVKTVTYNSKYGTLCTPTKTGHTFDGWYTEKTNGTKITENTIVSNYNNHTIYAHWKANTYHVSFDANKFETVDQTAKGLTITYDEKNSYLTLNGTYSSSGLQLMNLENQIFKTGDKYVITLTYLSGSYKLTGSGFFVTEIHQSNDADPATRNYYDLSFPTSGVKQGILTVNSDAASTGNRLVIWIWENTTNGYVFSNYKVKVNITKLETKEVTYGSAYGTLPANPTKKGYTFKGWYTKENGSGTKITNTTTMTTASDHTIYAHWNVNTYTATMDANGGTNGSYGNTWTATYGKKYNLDDKKPTRTGYTFDGWYSAKEGGTKYSGNWTWTSTKDYTFYAHWTAKTIKVTFYRNHSSTDTTTTTQTFTYGITDQSFNSGFSKTGYTALGWSTDRNATKATYSFKSGVADSWIKNHSPSITLYAIWRINVCTINYKPNGGKFNNNANNTTQKMNYGASTDNMRNATGSNGYYRATRSDAYNKAVSNKEWKTSSETTFDQSKGYSSTDFCPNLANGDQTVNLYVNWYDTKYRKRTCKTCKTCSVVSGTKCVSGHYECLYGCSSIGTQGYTERTSSTCTNPNTNWCAEKSRWYVCDTEQNITKNVTSCDSCGCDTWNAWSAYNLNSCTKNSSTQCGSKKVYPAIQD